MVKSKAGVYQLSSFYVGRLRATCSASILFLRFRAKGADVRLYIPPSRPVSQEGVSFRSYGIESLPWRVATYLYQYSVLLCNKSVRIPRLQLTNFSHGLSLFPISHGLLEQLSPYSARSFIFLRGNSLIWKRGFP